MPRTELEEILKQDPFQAVAIYNIIKVDIGLTNEAFVDLKTV